MPIIFASAILMFFQPMFRILGDKTGWARFHDISSFFAHGGSGYTLTFCIMILFFSYFWVATQFNPIQIADDLKRNGAYIPGIRPGRPTAEFLDRTMTRITLAGSVFLTAIAVVPIFMSVQFRIPYIVSQFFGGTSLLIIVGVMLDTMRQIESHLLTRHYDGFLNKGKLKTRR